jgi:hypothetical protein
MKKEKKYCGWCGRFSSSKHTICPNCGRKTFYLGEAKAEFEKIKEITKKHLPEGSYRLTQNINGRCTGSGFDYYLDFSTRGYQRTEKEQLKLLRFLKKLTPFFDFHVEVNSFYRLLDLYVKPRSKNFTAFSTLWFPIFTDNLQYVDKLLKAVTNLCNQRDIEIIMNRTKDAEKRTIEDISYYKKKKTNLARIKAKLRKIMEEKYGEEEVPTEEKKED